MNKDQTQESGGIWAYLLLDHIYLGDHTTLALQGIVHMIIICPAGDLVSLGILLVSVWTCSIWFCNSNNLFLHVTHTPPDSEWENKEQIEQGILLVPLCEKDSYKQITQKNNIWEIKDWTDEWIHHESCFMSPL